MATPDCPVCAKVARTTKTKYGLRHECCGLHSWDGKPLVSQAVHDARQAFHAIFDPLWKDAELTYVIAEAPDTDEHRQAVRRIRRSARNRAYLWLSAQTGLSEPERHGSNQEDLNKLKLLTDAARTCTGPLVIRDWYKGNRAVAA